MAVSTCAREATWIRNLCTYLGMEHINPVQIMVYNQTVIVLTKNPEHHKRTKQIHIRYHYKRELVEEGKIESTYIETEK